MEMTYALFALSLLAAFLSGVARGFHHARRDYPEANKARRWISRRRWAGWVVGQSYPWSADFAHQMIHAQVLLLALAGALFALVSPEWWLCIAYVWLVWFVEGRGFTLLYHVILPDDPTVPQYSVWVWLRGWIW